MIFAKLVWGYVWGSAAGKIALAGVAAFVGLKAIQYTGVQKERARVENVGKKVNDKASAARRAAERDARRMLDAYCRDC